MFCGAKNRYLPRTTPWSRGIKQEQSVTLRQGAGEWSVSDWGHGDDVCCGTSTHHRSADNVQAQLSGHAPRVIDKSELFEIDSFEAILETSET